MIVYAKNALLIDDGMMDLIVDAMPSYRNAVATALEDLYEEIETVDVDGPEDGNGHSVVFLKLEGGRLIESDFPENFSYGEEINFLDIASDDDSPENIADMYESCLRATGLNIPDGYARSHICNIMTED